MYILALYLVLGCIITAGGGFGRICISRQSFLEYVGFVCGYFIPAAKCDINDLGGKTMINSMTGNFRKAFSVISGKAWQLCGLILLGELLMALAAVFGFAPIISYPLKWTLEVGVSFLCLKCVRGQGTGSKDLFSGFSNFKHVACGMAWKTLWIAIWLIVPVYAFLQVIKPFISKIVSALFSEILEEAFGIYSYNSYDDSVIFDIQAAGVGLIIVFAIFVIAIITCCVFAIIKEIQYAFTPYILMDKPEVHCMDAIKLSKDMTRGIRGGIFGAVVIPALIVGAVDFILSLLASIPYIGVIFFLINAAFGIASVVFLAIFIDLVIASYYNNAAAGIPAPGAVAPAYYTQAPNGGYNPYPNQSSGNANGNSAPNGYDPNNGQPK